MALPYTYHYEGKIKKVILQFLRVFSGFQVQYDVDRDSSGTNDFDTVAVHYGDMDRVVANVLTDHGTFKAQKMPIITGYLTQIELDPENRKAKKHVESVVRTRASDGVKIASQRVIGAPYIANIDLAIWTTNSEQMMQIMEQILLIFNPRLTISTSTDIDDWSYISYAELIGLSNEQNFPVGTEDRALVQTLNFQVQFWLNYPKLEQDKIIEQIKTNIYDNTNEITFIETVITDENTPD